ncbi:MAG TPA: hypothetical protein VN520_20280 [Streptomyces sp.]|uniref:hypothetical protein n=1 Tax=Streptomyces sp. TaxID=1931 RepID=UPI002B881B50|nr:hypothetical protein [Streptomyces sp.]HWU08686.1 hypothetical protein [Streptomyces sp.]
MTNHTERMTEPAFGTEHRHTATPGSAAEAAPGAAPGRTPGAAAGPASADSKGLGPKSTGPGDLSVPPAPRTAPAAPPAERTGRHEAPGTDRSLISRTDQEKLSLRMQQAVTDFVESPRRAVEEADSTFGQIVSVLTEALAERGRLLRASWQEQDTEAQTEELRIALQRYRDISEQLLKT